MTQDELKTLLEYNALTGVFLWKVSISKRAKSGMLAGTFTRKGYIRVKLAGKMHQAHRLAWVYHYGEWPKGQVHHINCNKSDNRICNLRDVTNRTNCSNKKIHREGHLVGTYFHKLTQKWVSTIQVNGKQKYLGLYDTDLEASDVYQAALALINE